MADRITIPVEKIKNIEGRPWKVPEVDDDGEVVWENKEEEKPQMKEADSFDILRQVAFSIPQKVHAANDSHRGQQLFNQIARAKERDDGKIILAQDVYEWLHRLLNRNIPIPELEKKMGLEARAYKLHLWGLSAWTIEQQLTNIDQRAKPEDADLTDPPDPKTPTEEAAAQQAAPRQAPPADEM